MQFAALPTSMGQSGKLKKVKWKLQRYLLKATQYKVSVRVTLEKKICLYKTTI
jgi:hypothetical protein